MTSILRTVWGRVATSPRTPWLVGGVSSGFGFAVLYVVAVRTPLGQVLDIALFADMQFDAVRVTQVASMLRAGLPIPLALIGAALGSRALIRRQWRDLLSGAFVALVSVPLSTVLRDAVLVRPDLGEHGYLHNTLPSGHVSAVAALAWALVVLSPPAWRRTVRRAGVPTVVVACLASVTGYAHRPSDVLASLLLIAMVVCLTTACTHPPTTDRAAHRDDGRYGISTNCGTEEHVTAPSPSDAISLPAPRS